MTSIIKVDNIQDVCGSATISKCGTTITIGASGDTVTLAAGASQSGFGRSGSVNWDTTKKTTGFTAVSGNGYFCDTTSAAFTVTLPATPAAGDIVAIADYANTAATNNITVGRNGVNIDGNAIDGKIKVNGQAYTLIYVDATEGWKTVAQTYNQISTAEFIVATGGTITTCGDYKIHSFTGPGTFTVCSVGNPLGSDTVKVLLVAGGGGGGVDNGGGGGAGGVVFTPACASIPVSATAYPIAVGGGGNGAALPQGTGVAGTNTTGFSLTAVGGGYGGIGNPCSTAGQGSNGGSGGGDGAYDGPVQPAGGTATQPTQPGNSGTYGKGSAGGAGGNPPRASGGGGGANAAGTKGAGPGGTGGNGGNGVDVTPVFGASPKAFYIANSPGKGATAPGVFAGGGAGGAYCTGVGGTGGTGGGGNGGGSNPTTSPVGAGSAGTTNSGGGGGGGANFGPGGAGGNGGSGIVLIKYKFQ